MITYFKSLTTKIDDNKKPYTCTLQDHYKYHSLTSSNLTAPSLMLSHLHLEQKEHC
jgi:hypothetical protein